MRVNKNFLIPLIIITSLFIYYLGLRLYFFEEQVPVSPDESQSLFFSKLLADHQTLIYTNPLNENYNQNIFAARQFVQSEERTMPSAFLGYIVLLGLFRSVSEIGLYLSGPILAIICLIYVYKLTKYLFHWNAAIISIVLTGLLPVFVYWTESFFNNLAEATFIIGGIYYLIISVREKTVSSHILSAIFFSVAIWMRYTNLILIPLCIAPYYLFNLKNLKVTGIFLGIITYTAVIFPIFILNTILFGSPFSIGQNSKDQLVYDLLLKDVPKEIIPYVPFRSFDIFLVNARDYLISITPLLSTGAILGIASIRNKINFRSEISLLIYFCVIWSVYYLGGLYFGYGSEPNVNSSYARYLLVIYIVFTIFLSYFISSINKKFIQLVVIVISLIAYFSISANARVSLTSLKNQISGSRTFLAQMESATPNDAIIFVKGADKILFPTRNTALYMMLSKNETRKNEGVKETVALMSQLVEDGHPVYIMREDDFYPEYKLDLYLHELPYYKLKVEHYNQSLNLYKINSQ